LHRACLLTGIGFIWLSVVVVSWGTHLRTQSSNFETYRLATFREHAGTTEERLNPVGRMALVMSFSWQFEFCFGAFVAAVLMAGLLGIRAVSRRYRNLSLFLAIAFSLGCLAGAVGNVSEARECFQWGFVTLGVGHLLCTAGLSSVSLAVARFSLRVMRSELHLEGSVLR